MPHGVLSRLSKTFQGINFPTHPTGWLGSARATRLLSFGLSASLSQDYRDAISAASCEGLSSHLRHLLHLRHLIAII